MELSDIAQGKSFKKEFLLGIETEIKETIAKCQGVNHHLSFMKRTVEKLYLTDAVTTGLTVVALGAAFFLFLLGVGALRKGWGMATSTAGAVLALAFVVELRLPSLKALPVWPVLLGITALAFVLQVLKLAILHVKDGGVRR